MELLDAIEVDDGVSSHRIELFLGDLLDLPAADPVDLLVVSAFPEDYTPTPGSLIGALDTAGVSLAALAQVKARDLRSVFSCWLSPPVAGAGHGFHRVLCFEPLVRGSAPEVVDDIFRALHAVTLDAPEDVTVATPLVASGDQGWPAEAMILPLLEATEHWLGLGARIRCLKIVERSPDKARLLADAFASFRARHRRGPDQAQGRAEQAAGSEEVRPDAMRDFDIFISYAHENRADVDALVGAITELRPQVRIFVDHLELGVGVDWLSRIVDTLDRTRTVVVVFSPEYFRSKWCLDELHTAILRDNSRGQETLFPVYLYSAEVPTFYLAKTQHLDCREGDRARLAEAAEELAARLSS